MLLTHAYVHWLVDMHLAVFAPACGRQARISFADLQLASLIFDSLCRFTTANAPATNGHDQRE
jgi:hypothetical protein